MNVGGVVELRAQLAGRAGHRRQHQQRLPDARSTWWSAPPQPKSNGTTRHLRNSNGINTWRPTWSSSTVLTGTAHMVGIPGPRAAP